jgi:hypothetical protein
MARHLERSVALRSAGERCPPVGAPRPLRARAGHVRVEWRFSCAVPGDLEIDGGFFFDVAPGHLHFARVFVADSPAVEYLFSNTERGRSISVVSSEDTHPARGASAIFSRYVELGVEHILAGVDHLAFLLALLLLCRRVRDVALLVTGFTLGHSATLSLAALGVLQPDSGVIEALIGFTIALVAAEATGVASGASARIGAVGAAALSGLALLSLWRGVGPPPAVLVGLALITFCTMSLAQDRQTAIRLSPVLTMVFGLVHGFGFASVLLDVGMPSERLFPALLGFNVGVELGQLVCVAAVFCAGRVVARSLRAEGFRLGADAMAAALCGLGLFWFVDRAYGG